MIFDVYVVLQSINYSYKRCLYTTDTFAGLYIPARQKFENIQLNNQNYYFVPRFDYLYLMKQAFLKLFA